jgi:hypothetical protein
MRAIAACGTFALIALALCTPAAIALSDGKLGAAIPADQRFDTTGAPDGDPLQAVTIPAAR